MTDTPKKVVVNIQDGTEEYIDLTPQEIAQRDQDAAALAEARAEQELETERVAALKESAKAKLISGDPLTEEEAATLVI